MGKVLDGKATGRVLSGDMVRDIVGTYYNYSLTLGTSSLSPAEYDTLYDILSAPVNSHSITLPYGQKTITFDAYVSNTDDELLGVNDTQNLWGNLAITFTAMRPKRKP